MFPCKPGSVYKLYYGNESARGPSYDLESFSSKVMESDPPLWDMSTAVRNPSFKPKNQVTPESERHKWLLPSVLAILAAGLIVLIVKLAPKVTREQ